MTEKQYKDPFTKDGRVRPVPGVTEEKVEYLDNLITETLGGNRAAKGELEEAMTSTDAVFNLAYLTELNVLAEFEDFSETPIGTISTQRLVSDFRPVTMYRMRPDWSASGTLGSGEPVFVAPPVPEGANYAYAYLEQESSQSEGGVIKRGFKTGFTFEAFINDAVGFLQALPDEMRRIAVDTDTWEVFNALITGVTAAEQLDGGPIPFGEDTITVAPNAPISRNALVRAMIEVGEREIDGRKVVVSGGWTLLIPAGQRLWVEYILNNVVGPIGYEDGSAQFLINGYNPLAGIDIIESEFITGNQWFLLPKANQARRPVLELLRLAGHEQPELRVHGNTGSYVGGGEVNPFEGNFDNDTADFRLRLFTKGILWTRQLVVWSNGSGTA